MWCLFWNLVLAVLKLIEFPNGWGKMRVFVSMPLIFSGGIWVLWKSTVVNLQVHGTSDQFIHLRGSSSDMESFLLTTVYAKPSILARDALWARLGILGMSISDLWMLAGDFNAMLSP
ncbi:hypothetical protein LINGRAHAP2_LOCUS22880 [Linum grandiflorum]